MLLAIRNVSKSFSGSGAQRARAVAEIALVTSSAIVRLVHIRALPWLVSDVSAARALCAVAVKDANMTPAAVLTRSNPKIRDIQALLARLKLRALIDESERARDQTRQHGEGDAA